MRKSPYRVSKRNPSEAQGDRKAVGSRGEEKYLTAEFWSRLSVGEFKVPEFPDEAE